MNIFKWILTKDEIEEIKKESLLEFQEYVRREWGYLRTFDIVNEYLEQKEKEK